MNASSPINFEGKKLNPRKLCIVNYTSDYSASMVGGWQEMMNFNYTIVDHEPSHEKNYTLAYDI
jgi:hypothetical protein